MDWATVVAERGYVIDIGQLSREDIRALDKEAKAGRAVKRRGCFDTLEQWGCGPLKTIWRKVVP